MKRKENLDQLRRWTVKELSAKITEAKKELLTMNQEKILGHLKNVASIGLKKRSIARMSTILDEKLANSN